jgi:Phosphotransferase enzyme family
VTGWIDERVERTGDVELMLARPWSAIVRVPTAEGEAWFKENAPASAFEPALTELLAETRSDMLPETIAWEGPRIITKDAGPRLRNVLDAGATEPSWEEILPLYAELQIGFMDVAERALDLGTPDDRPELLPERYAALGGDRPDAVRRAAERLAGSVPPTVAHMEAHDGNVFVRDGEPVFIDWAEAVVTHPFVGPLLALRSATERLGYEPGSPEVDRLRDLYLEPFTTFAPLAELRRLFADGYLLFPISRADSWRRTLEGTPGSMEFGDPVNGWLEILAEIADGTTTLGGA